MFWVSNVSLFLIPTEVGVSAILYTNIFPPTSKRAKCHCDAFSHTYWTEHNQIRMTPNNLTSWNMWNNVVSWLVARFAIVARIYQIILNPCNVSTVHHCGKFFFGNFFCQKKCACKKLWTFFLKKSCFSPCSKRIRPLIKPLLKNSFSTNFQGTWPWEGPIHFSRFVLSVHICSKLFPELILEPREERKTFYKSNLFFLFFFLFPFLFLFLFLLLFLSFSFSRSLSLFFLVPFLFSFSFSFSYCMVH